MKALSLYSIFQFQKKKNIWAVQRIWDKSHTITGQQFLHNKAERAGLLLNWWASVHCATYQVVIAIYHPIDMTVCLCKSVGSQLVHVERMCGTPFRCMSEKSNQHTLHTRTDVFLVWTSLGDKVKRVPLDQCFSSWEFLYWSLSWRTWHTWTWFSFFTSLSTKGTNFMTVCRMFTSGVRMLGHVSDEVPNPLATLQMVMSVCVDVIYNSCHIFLCFANRCWSWAFSILDIHHFTFVLWKPIECFNSAYCYQNVTHIISNIFSMNHILTIQLCLTHH